MNLSDPTRAITATLDGTVLSVLAAAGRPLTVSEVAAKAARGSEIGLRRAIARLIDQGIVRATEVGRNRVHELNRDHIAAPAAEILRDLRLELWRRLRTELATWRQEPVFGCVFGSAARGDGDDNSDIDLLLVHTPLRGEQPSRKTDDGALMQFVREVTATQTAKRFTPPDSDLWHEQVDRLRDLVHRWTGNPLQVVDLSFYEWSDPSDDLLKLLTEVRRDGIEVARTPLLPPAAFAGAHLA
ncbi:MAG: nucleotidyltransferase domain-containing protein [Mycobacteriales bacterium]